MDLGPVLSPVKDLGAFIRDQRTAAQISVRALAAKTGVSNPYLSQVERGLRRPSAEILAQIATGLSISVESLLIRAGVLEPPTDAAPVVEAIRADPALSERHKLSLIEIYTAFRSSADERLPGSDPAGPLRRADQPGGSSQPGASAETGQSLTDFDQVGGVAESHQT